MANKFTKLSTHRTPSGYLLPSIHSYPPFFTYADFYSWLYPYTLNFVLFDSQQLSPNTVEDSTDHWVHLLISYARYRKLFFLRLDDVEAANGDWDEVLRNERINRRVKQPFLNSLLESLVARNLASYEPAQQTGAVLLYWRTPDEWAEVLHNWVTSTGQLNTILTLYEITDPPVESPLTGLPIVLLRKAIAVLAKTGRAQLIAITDGEGVRFFPSNSR